MAKDDVVITMSVRDANTFAAWQRARKGVADVGDEMDKTGRKGKKAGDDTNRSWQRMLKGMVAGVSAVLGIGSAFSAMRRIVTTEFDTMERRQSRFFNQQFAFAGTIRKVSKALGPGQDVTIAQAEQLIRSQTFGVPEADAAELAIALLSTKGSAFSARRSLNIGGLINLMTPELAVGERVNLGEAVIATAKGFPEATDEQIASTVINALAASRSRDIDKFADI